MKVRLTVRRLVQTASPLLRAFEQPRCVSLIIEKPPPQASHVSSFENVTTHGVSCVE